MNRESKNDSKYGNGDYQILGTEESPISINDDKETKEEKVPSFPLYVTGKVDEYKRLEIINVLVRELYDEFREEIAHTRQNSEAYKLYDTLSSVFETKKGRNDGWERMISEHVCKITALGQTWGDPIKQRGEINKLFYILFGSQIAEFFFAFSNAGMSIKDYYDELSSIKPLFRLVISLLFLQALISTYINWNGIDRVVESQGKIGPVIRIGKKVIIGTEAQAYDQNVHTHLDFEFDIDPKFRPCRKRANANGQFEYEKRNTYNPQTVKFFNHGIKLWYQSQKKFYERPWLTAITEFLNKLSFPWTNNWAASINSYIILDLLKGWKSDIGKLAIAVPSVSGLVYVGNYYYEAFTGENVKKAVKRFWTSEDPLTQTGMISGWQRLEVETQWILNGLARGTSIALGVYSVVELVAEFLKPLFEVPGMVTYAIPIISFFMAVINTLLSRKKGAEKYLAPFKITGPTCLDTFTVPDEKLFDFLSNPQPQLTWSEILKEILPWAIAYGLTFAVPTWIGISGGTTFALLDIGISLGVLGIKSLFTAKAETPHKRHLKLRAAINEIINPPAAEEIKLDRNGNQKFTNADTAKFNTIGNLLEQASRIESRAGQWQGVQKKYGLPSFGSWQDPLALNTALVSPTINEFGLYAGQTAPVITSGFNAIRESAGTPSSEIKGWGISNFTSRQLVCFLPCIFVKDKPVSGISDQTWTQWFSGFWNYEREVKDTRTVEAAPDLEDSKEEKYRVPQITERQRGCLACISRVFSTRRSNRTVNDYSYAEGLLDVNSRAESHYSNGGSRTESKYDLN